MAVIQLLNLKTTETKKYKSQQKPSLILLFSSNPIAPRSHPSVLTYFQIYPETILFFLSSSTATILVQASIILAWMFVMDILTCNSGYFLLKTLESLPMTLRIKSKLLNLGNKALHDLVPANHSNLITTLPLFTCLNNSTKLFPTIRHLHHLCLPPGMFFLWILLSG